MRTLLLLLISLFCISPTLWAAAPPLVELQQANALLQAELKLAKSGNPYLMIDLQENRLLMKASGQPLQAWAIAHYRQWGQSPALPVSSLESKSSLDEPEREVQLVNTNQLREDVANKPFKALELADMPSAYRMHLMNGTDISVHPTPTGWLSHVYGIFAVPAWYISRPLISNWNFLRSSPYNELALAMSEQDARMLYWAFSEGTPCLIRLPAAAVATVPLPAGTKE